MAESSRQKVQESWRNAPQTFWCCTLGLWGASHMMNEGFMLVYMHIGSGKDNLVESHQKAVDKSAVLYCGQNLIRSQCSSCRSGVTWSYLDFLRTSCCFLQRCFGLSVSVKSASRVILQEWNCSSQAGMIRQMKGAGHLQSESSMVGLKLFSVQGTLYGIHCWCVVA